MKHWLIIVKTDLRRSKSVLTRWKINQFTNMENFNNAVSTDIQIQSLLDEQSYHNNDVDYLFELFHFKITTLCNQYFVTFQKQKHKRRAYWY